VYYSPAQAPVAEVKDNELTRRNGLLTCVEANLDLAIRFCRNNAILIALPIANLRTAL